MNQLTLSFHDEILLRLKTKNWEFKYLPDSLNPALSGTAGNKFIRLDRSDNDVKPAGSAKKKFSKKNK